MLSNGSCGQLRLCILMWWNLFFYLGSISWATVLVYSHLVTLQQLSLTILTGLRFCFERNYSVLEPQRCAKHIVACQHSQQTRDIDPILGPPSAMLAQHQTSTGSTPRVCWTGVWQCMPQLTRNIETVLV